MNAPSDPSYPNEFPALLGLGRRLHPLSRTHSFTLLILGVFLLWTQATMATEPWGNLAPDAALQAFEVEPGFHVSLVAAEPLTVDPVALAFDERGRCYVAENRDYPLGQPEGVPAGRIALLEDTDGDGRMDRRFEFATAIRFPNGVMCWRGGVIVTASPDVWWLADTNQDGRADVQERLLSGFDTASTSQLRANDPTVGPDGWVYLAGGLRGGNVFSPKHPNRVVNTDKNDLRFRPDTGEIELIDGKSQFGLAFDDAGHRFACMNRIQVQHAPLPSRYLARNPLVPSPGALENCPEIQDNTLMTRYTAGAARFYPISDNLTTADSHLGTYSAACAVHIYRGNEPALSAYHGAAFSCDPTGNLVRGDRLVPRGGTFAAERIREGTEALRSRDNWFRPVFLADGPDGALYVADMYRKVIEHPEYLPGDVRKHMDFEAGRTQGRIWRLGAARRTRPKFVALPANKPADLLKELHSEIPWRRDTAFRLLIERSQTASFQRQVRAAFLRTEAAAPAVAFLNLLALEAPVDRTTVLRALKHRQPIVRQKALRLAESQLAHAHDPAVIERVLVLADDPHPHVRFQAALNLGLVRDPRVIPALARIARHQAFDRWTRAAMLSSLPDRTAALSLLAALRQSKDPLPEGFAALAGDLGQLAGSGVAAAARSTAWTELQECLHAASATLALPAIAGFARADPAEFQNFAQSQSVTDTAALVFRQARQAAADPSTSLPLRVASLELLAFDGSPETTALLPEQLAARHPREVQRAAARALLQVFRRNVIPDQLAAERWNSFTPGVRSMMLDRLCSVPELSGMLLDAIGAQHVPPSSLTPNQREQLRRSKVPEVKQRAETLLAPPGGNREASFVQTKASLALTPTPANGRAVFAKACATCHRLNQQGVAVGPDLFDIRHQPKETILYHLVVPEAEIAPNFVNYDCELKDGRAFSGLLASENASHITLRMAQGVEESFPRAQIARLTASPLSLMPQELEKTMTLQELADLLSYLKGEQ